MTFDSKCYLFHLYFNLSKTLVPLFCPSQSHLILTLTSPILSSFFFLYLFSFVFHILYPLLVDVSRAIFFFSRILHLNPNYKNNFFVCWSLLYSLYVFYRTICAFYDLYRFQEIYCGIVFLKVTTLSVILYLRFPMDF